MTVPAFPPSPPYLGSAYYPEAWPASEMDRDIALMQQAGMNVARIGEFAWSRMEPAEGKIELAWLHTVIDKLARAGIATILGTPTATPPAWLTHRYPDVLFLMDDGRPIPHGGRRHYCPNNEIYRQHSARITTALAEAFGKDDRVLGWQIDNEVSYYRRPCCCRVCHRKFREAMWRKFGEIDALNDAWNLDLWSQRYDSFEQLPIPRRDIWHHPSLLQAWSQFGSDSYVEFVRLQADILHKSAKQPVGTDMMCTNAVDYFDIHQGLDVVQHNHYHGMDSLWESLFWFDFCRPLKPTPFWNTETATCWNGSVTANGYKEPGFCVANSWLPIALGGEANLYWLWRQHRAGQELMHGAVVDSHARPMHIWEEVRQVSAGYRKAAAFLNSTAPIRSGVAIHCSGKTEMLFSHQPMVNNFDYRRTLMERIYRPILQAQLRPDVLHAGLPLAGVKVLLSPLLPMLDEYGLRDRLKAWIEAGGTWVAGPLTDNRTAEGTKFLAAPFGSLEQWAGVHTQMSIPGDPRQFALRWTDGRTSEGAVWYDAFQVRDAGAKILATYTDGPMKGLAAAVERPMGRGKIVLLGTVLPKDAWQELVLGLCQEQAIRPVATASENLLVAPRTGPDGESLVVVEYENKPAELTLPRPMVDLLTGETLRGQVTIAPYGVRVLQSPAAPPAGAI